MKTKNIFAAILATAMTSGLFGQGITIESEITNPSCFGEFNGSISVNATGGTAPYYYYWSTRDNLANVYGLSAGEYTLIVADAAGNSVTQNFVLTQPEALTIEGSVTKVTTYGGQNGSIDLTVGGLTSDYTVEWTTSNGSGVDQGQLDQHGLSAGTYTVTITTAAGCQNTKSFTITQKLPLFFNPGMLGMTPAGENEFPVVYPNPSNGAVNFRNADATDVVEIYNQFGTLMQTMSAMEATQLSTGNYTVKFKKADGTMHSETLIVR
jgi:hypothetical protein